MIERKPPTHVLTIEVPLHSTDPVQDPEAVRQALSVCLAVSKAGFDGLICDDPQVTLAEASS